MKNKVNFSFVEMLVFHCLNQFVFGKLTNHTQTLFMYYDKFGIEYYVYVQG